MTPPTGTHHLSSQNQIEHEASNEPTKNQPIIHLLQRRINPRQTPKEVVENLHRNPTSALTPHEPTRTGLTMKALSCPVPPSR